MPRAPLAPLHALLGTLSAGEFDARCRARDLAFRDQGITFSLSGRGAARSLSTSCPGSSRRRSGQVIEAGVAQRVRALEAFLADIYGPGEILRRRRDQPRGSSTPPASSAGPQPAWSRPTGPASRSPGSTWCAIRTAATWCSRTTCARPSGISYVVENRRAMTHVFPELFASHRVRPVVGLPGPPARGPAAPRRRRTGPSRRWWSSPPGWPTRPTSSTSSWPARWGSSWSRAGT